MGYWLLFSHLIGQIKSHGQAKVKGKGKYTQHIGNLVKEDTNTYEQIPNYYSLLMAIPVSTPVPSIFSSTQQPEDSY